MSVENKVLNLLRSKDWVSNSELEHLFPEGVKGHYSWPQRLRGLRDKGFIIRRRIKEGTNNLSEWHLQEVEPQRTEQEEAVAQNNLRQEEVINTKVCGRQVEFII